MRVFIAVLILIFSLQSWTKADDIRDFEIEGMSVGESLLDFYTQEKIEKTRVEFSSKYKKYSYSEINGNFENFENLQFMYDKKDNKYKIVAIVGIIFYDNDLDNCLKQKKIITKSVKSVMPSNTDIYNDDGYPHSQKFPKSLVYTTQLTFNNGDMVRVYCLDWSQKIEKDKGWTDHLSLSVQTKDFLYWLDNKAYE